MIRKIISLWLATAVVMFGVWAHRARAQTTWTWIGTGAGADWGTAGNWSTTSSGIPASNGEAVFNSGGTATVSVASNEPVLDIEFDSGANDDVIGSTSGGTLALGAGGTIGIASGASSAEIVDAPLTLAGSYTFTTSALSGGNLTIGGSVTDAAASGTQTLFFSGKETGTITGLISDGSNGGKLEISKSASGTWVLNDNSNSFSGGVIIGQGTLSATTLGMSGGASAVGTGAITLGTSSNAASLDYIGTGETSNKTIAIEGSNVSIVAAQTTGTGLVLSGTFDFEASAAGTLTLSGNSGFTNTLESVIANSGNNATSLKQAGSDTWVLTGANTYSGTTSISAGATLQIGNGGMTGTLGGGAVTVNFTTGTPGELVFDRSNAYSVPNVISGEGGITQAGAGVLTFTGNNMTSGVTTLEAGELSVATISSGGAPSNLGAASSAASNLVFDGGALQYTGVSASTTRAFTIESGEAAIFDITTNDLTITGGNAGTTDASLTKIGSGTLTLGDGTTDPTYVYAGATTVSAGTLVVNGSIAASSGVSLASGASLAGTGTVSAVTLAGSNTLSSTGTLTTAGITVGGTGNNLSSGTVVGNATVGSSAALAIASGATLTGTATTAGLLTNNGTISSTVQVQNAGTLNGSGTFNGAVTINSGGTFAPSLGSGTFSGNLTLNGATQMQINGASYSAASVAGTLTYGGSLNLVFASTASAGQSFNLFATSGPAAAGDFSSVSLSGSGYSGTLADNAGVWTGTDNGLEFTFTDSTGVLTTTMSAVPEPSNYALIVGGLALGVALYRRRRDPAVRSPF